MTSSTMRQTPRVICGVTGRRAPHNGRSIKRSSKRTASPPKITTPITGARKAIRAQPAAPMGACSGGGTAFHVWLIVASPGPVLRVKRALAVVHAQGIHYKTDIGRVEVMVDKCPLTHKSPKAQI